MKGLETLSLVEELRELLNIDIDEKNLSNANVLKMSKELDSAIIEYYNGYVKKAVL